MLITKREVGPLSANCYIVADEEAKEAVVVDPGGEGDMIAELCRQQGLAVRYIINTHGHADHILGNAALKEATGAQLLVHEADKEMLTSAQLSLAAYVGEQGKLIPPDRILREGDELPLGALVLKILHTPGHTPGGICLAVENALFTGDTLFAESVGRTDFPGGSHMQLLDSIKTKLYTYPDDTVVYPGHGPSTTIQQEKVYNPFVRA